MEIAGQLSDFKPFVVGAFSLVVTYIVLPVIIRISHQKHLFDSPTGFRKIHKQATPNLGGVGIFAAFMITFSVSGYATEPWVPYLMGGLIILFFSGIKDDILVISPFKKLILQCLAVAAIIFGGDLVITNLGGVFGYHEIPYPAGAALTFFTMVVVINSYNLIDGIDGLAGGIGVIASLSMGAWFWWVGIIPEAVAAFVLAGSLLAFLWYNFEPASIFMGDTGSQVVGFLLAFLAVSFVSQGVASTVAVPFQPAIPVLILSVLVVPLYDTLRVFIMRVTQGRSPFRPDRLHVHHQLLDLGLSHKSTCYIIYAFNVAIIGMTLLLAPYLSINMLLGFVLLTAVVVFPTLRIKRRLLLKAGIKLPSARRIHILERKYGISSPAARRRLNGNSHGTKEYGEIAV